MSLRYILTIGFLLVVASAFTPAHAFNDTVSFRLSPNGGFQAVVSGMEDGLGCRPEFPPPSSVQIIDGSIEVFSTNDPPGCFLPPDHELPYEVVAELGPLSDSVYHVTWTYSTDVYGTLHLTGVLVPSQLLGTPTIPLPTLSLPLLIALGFGLFAVGLLGLSRRRRVRS